MTILDWIIRFLLLTVLVELVLNKHTDRIWEIFTKSATRTGLSLTGIGILIVAEVVRYRSRKRTLLKQQFHLIKDAEELLPEDLNFEIVSKDQLGECSSTRRPYVPETYLQRSAVPYHQRNNRSISTIYDEIELCELLRSGTSILLIGPPTEGKTRTLFELVDRMRGYSVVTPRLDVAPSEHSIQLLRGKKVILLLDDLTAYDRSTIDLIGLNRSISMVAASCVMLATSRLGPEMMSGGPYVTGLRRLGEYFTLFFLTPATLEQQRLLAKSLNQVVSKAVPTLGFISMRGILSMMATRFSNLPAVTQDCFRALQLQAAGGIETNGEEQLHTVLRCVFGRNLEPISVRDALDSLMDQGFIARSSTKSGINPHSAYLVGPAASMFYKRQDPPDVDLGALADCFHRNGEYLLANRVGLSMFLTGNRQSALEVWLRTVERTEGRTEPAVIEARARALYNRGMGVGLMDNHTEEIAAYDQLLCEFHESESPKITSIVAKAFSAKSRALAILKRYSQALETTYLMEERFSNNQDLEIQVSVARTRQYRAGVHALAGDFAAAESVYAAIRDLYETTTVPEVQEVLAFALTNQARVWVDRGEYEQAIAQYDRVVATFSGVKRPGMVGVIAQTLLNKAMALIAQKEFAEASSVLEQLYHDFGREDLAAVPSNTSIADRSEYAVNAATINGTLAHALSNLHAIHAGNGRYTEADAVLTQLLTKFGGSEQSDIKIYIITALRNRAAGLFESGNSVAALEACTDLGERYSSDADIVVRNECAVQLSGLAEILYRRHGRFDDAAKVFACVTHAFQQDPELSLRVVVARSMVNHSVILMQMSQNQEAIDVCEQILVTFGAAAEPDFRQAVDMAYQNRAIALGRMGIL